MSSLDKTKQGIILMIAASLFFSFMGALVKFVTKDISSMEAVFFRSLVTLVLVTPWMIKNKIPLIGKNIPLLLIRSASGFIALSLTFYITSQIMLADVSLLNRTSIPFVAILAILFLREKVTLPLMIYTFCSFIGAAMIIKPQLDIVNIPGFLGLLAGFLAGIAYISVKALHKTESFFTIVFSFAAFSTLASLAFISKFSEPTPIQWIALISIGLCGTVAQLCMTYSYKFTDASIISPYSFSTVLFSGLWGYLYWNEIPDLWSFLGALLIIACGIGIMKLKKSKGETPIELEEDWADQAENKN